MHRIHQPAPLAILCSALALSGCGTDSGPDPTNPSTVAAVRPQLQSVGSQPRATGVALITLPNDPNQWKQRFSFTAARRRDGSVGGRFTLYSEQNAGVRFRGRVTCLAVEGTAARIGGIITKSIEGDFLEGSPILWSVVDRGRGGTAPPDLTTDVLIPLFSHEVEEFCAGTLDPGLPFVEIERGNIRVSP